jgi:hypothetical protein
VLRPSGAIEIEIAGMTAGNVEIETTDTEMIGTAIETMGMKTPVSRATATV